LDYNLSTHSTERQWDQDMTILVLSITKNFNSIFGVLPKLRNPNYSTTPILTYLQFSRDAIINAELTVYQM